MSITKSLRSRYLKASCCIILIGLLLIGLGSSQEESEPLFDLDEIRDPSNLEIKVLQDWHLSKQANPVWQKLIEITVCEWWPGQKVRLPVTLLVPQHDDFSCSHVLIVNQPLAKKIGRPRGVPLELLKDHDVGIVMIGMGTIDAMEPVGTLQHGMRKHLLATKNPRFTPAWIWGISQMRALTAAMSEPVIFLPEKVLATGGSKRGIASAVAGIHDDRFTAILPVVAPPLGNPGAAAYVMGTEPEHLAEIDRKFYEDLAAGKLGLELTAEKALRERAGRRADNRVTLEQAREAKWSDHDIAKITDRVWDASRITNYLPGLRQRKLDIFYNVGTNDSVTPALLELGKRFPDFPVCIIPGGQHGGPATAGFTRRTPLLPEIQDNLMSFARHHFFGHRDLISPPRITSTWDAKTETLSVTVTFPGGEEPGKNQLWWCPDRSEPYTLPFEYDPWSSIPLNMESPGTYRASLSLEDSDYRKIDFLSLHTHIVSGMPFTISSPYRRIIIK